MNEKLNEWRKNQGHLPDVLKDFHVQKELFRFIHEFCDMTGNHLVSNINYQQGHAYTVDVFLHVMARFGYTLQKSRAHQDFDELDSMMTLYKNKRAEYFNEMLKSNSHQKPDTIE